MLNTVKSRFLTTVRTAFISGKGFWKGVLKVLIEVVLTIIKSKVEKKLEDMNNPTHPAKAGFGDVVTLRKAQDKLDDLNKPKHGKVIRLLIIVIVGITVIGLTAWATKPMELPSEVIIIRPLPVEDNPYQKEYDELLSPCVMVETITGRGSGVVISTTDEHGYTLILTAGHVVGNYAKVSVTFYSYVNTNQSILCELSASVVITDTNKDLALLSLKADKYNLKTAQLAPKTYTPYLFTPVWVVGCSLGLNPRPSEGIITAITYDSWEISAPVLPGNSGGPVFDAGTHELIGIAVWVRLYGDQLITTMAGIVPIGEIYDFLEAPNLKHQIPNKHQSLNNWKIDYWNLFGTCKFGYWNLFSVRSSDATS
jgi:S1-C subfamily serine protease